MYFWKINKKLEKRKFKSDIILKKSFFFFLKKFVKKFNNLNLKWKKSGCKNYIFFFYLKKNIDKSKIILNFNSYNLIINNIIFIFLLNSKLYLIKKNLKSNIIIKKILLKNICNCGVSFNLK